MGTLPSLIWKFTSVRYFWEICDGCDNNIWSWIGDPLSSRTGISFGFWIFDFCVSKQHVWVCQLRPKPLLNSPKKQPSSMLQVETFHFALRSPQTLTKWGGKQLVLMKRGHNESCYVVFFVVCCVQDRQSSFGLWRSGLLALRVFNRYLWSPLRWARPQTAVGLLQPLPAAAAGPWAASHWARSEPLPSSCCSAEPPEPRQSSREESRWCSVCLFYFSDLF